MCQAKISIALYKLFQLEHKISCPRSHSTQLKQNTNPDSLTPNPELNPNEEMLEGHYRKEQNAGMCETTWSLQETTRRSISIYVKAD